MMIRRYDSSDIEEIGELFYNTIHTVNRKDYTQEQIDAWAPGSIDYARWDQALSEHYSVVAVEDGKIIGFGDIAENGYLDRLFVHHNYQRRGAAFAICRELEQNCAAPRLWVEASITARPFFERMGYRTVKQQQVEKRGVWLTNFVMEKERELSEK